MTASRRGMPSIITGHPSQDSSRSGSPTATARRWTGRPAPGLVQPRGRRWVWCPPSPWSTPTSCSSRSGSTTSRTSTARPVSAASSHWLLDAILAAAPRARVCLLGIPPLDHFPAFPRPLADALGWRGRVFDAIGVEATRARESLPDRDHRTARAGDVRRRRVPPEPKASRRIRRRCHGGSVTSLNPLRHTCASSQATTSAVTSSRLVSLRISCRAPSYSFTVTSTRPASR